MATTNMTASYTPRKALACAAVLALALSACGPVTTDAQDAAQACSGIPEPNPRYYCMGNFINGRQANRDLQWNMIGNSLMSYGHPARVTCMNIGGIVSCQ